MSLVTGTPEKAIDASVSHCGLRISNELFTRYQQLIYRETGIWLGPAKMALLCGRLSRRMRALGIISLEEYFQFVTGPSAADELVLMIDAITTNETHFFREPKHFEFLRETMIPRWQEEVEEGARRKQVRIWSAGCSTGEEPYSIAMLLLHHLPGWDLQVFATDISTKVLVEARRGVYKAQKSASIPAELLRLFALQGIGDQEGNLKIVPAAQKIVRFQRLNLHQIPPHVPNDFDAIFCRNVLIYFSAESKKSTVSALLRHLRPGGLLFLGHAENLNGVTCHVRNVAPTIYQRADYLPIN